MRSCEYSKVLSRPEDRWTKLLKVKNVRFFHNGRQVSRHDPSLVLLDFVAITFEFQKRGDREETVTMH